MAVVWDAIGGGDGLLTDERIGQRPKTKEFEFVLSNSLKKITQIVPDPTGYKRLIVTPYPGAKGYELIILLTDENGEGRVTKELNEVFGSIAKEAQKLAIERDAERASRQVEGIMATEDKKKIVKDAIEMSKEMDKRPRPWEKRPGFVDDSDL